MFRAIRNFITLSVLFILLGVWFYPDPLLSFGLTKWLQYPIRVKGVQFQLPDIYIEQVELNPEFSRLYPVTARATTIDLQISPWTFLTFPPSFEKLEVKHVYVDRYAEDVPHFSLPINAKSFSIGKIEYENLQPMGSLEDFQEELFSENETEPQNIESAHSQQVQPTERPHKNLPPQLSCWRSPYRGF